MKTVTRLTTALAATALALLAPAAARAESDGTRVRGGLSAGGGFVYVTSDTGSAIAPALGVAGRVGVQINNLFAVYYQNMAAVPVGGGGTGFFDYNAFMASVTGANVIDFGVGPSADVIMVSSGSTTKTAALFGLHSRLGFQFGGEPKHERRQGFSLALDLHPTFGPGGVLFTMGASAGYEWY